MRTVTDPMNTVVNLPADRSTLTTVNVSGSFDRNDTGSRQHPTQVSFTHRSTLAIANVSDHVDQAC